MNFHENALKTQSAELIADYLHNPCTATADNMFHSVFKWPRPMKGRNHGIILSIVSECVRRGYISQWNPGVWIFRIYLALAELWSYASKTWDDHISLEWSFTRDPLCVQALHYRCHRPKCRESASTIMRALLADEDFAEHFRLTIVPKCPECCVAFGDCLKNEVA